eukprot:8067831-Pyramimonas_sp.AAC.1
MITLNAFVTLVGLSWGCLAAGGPEWPSFGAAVALWGAFGAIFVPSPCHLKAIHHQPRTYPYP